MWRMLSVWLGAKRNPPMGSLDPLRLSEIRKSNDWRFPWFCGLMHPVSGSALVGSRVEMTTPTLDFVAACSKLTELTVVSPYPSGAQQTGTGILFDLARRARPAISELIVACKALPDFDTLQIIHYPVFRPVLTCWCGRDRCGSHWPSSGQWQWEPALEKHAKDLGAWAIDCLKKPKTGCCAGEGRKKTTKLRVIKFCSGHPCRSAVKVEECEV